VSILGDGNLKLANSLAKDGLIDASKQMIFDIKKDIEKQQSESMNSTLMKLRVREQRRSISFIHP
jgi:hypothetical protein